MEFVKAHANGNDFILSEHSILNPAEFAVQYCRPKLGIGGDGLILIQLEGDLAKLRFFNPDGTEPDFCGNGCICSAGYLYRFHGLRCGKLKTKAGEFRYSIESAHPLAVKLQMPSPRFKRCQIPALGDQDSELIQQILDGFPYPVSGVNTGVPHAVVFLRDLDRIPIQELAPKLRFHPIFPQGANVDLAELIQDGIRIRTYERGLEAESLSCGTGALAVAAVAHKLGWIQLGKLGIVTKMGKLWVSKEGQEYYLSSKAELVFKAQLLQDLDG